MFHINFSVQTRNKSCINVCEFYFFLDIVKDVIRHCIFMRTNEDNVIIRQGDSGDR